ncbi:hypothetical protein [Thalassotalea algicola]|nr:hypothetical protein [Thalassotalea algicola]
MNRPASKGFKLTTVIFAVLFLAVSAVLSNTSVADDTEVILEQSE